MLGLAVREEVLVPKVEPIVREVVLLVVDAREDVLYVEPGREGPPELEPKGRAGALLVAEELPSERDVPPIVEDV
eukprot:COSAG01_NODE_2542_length_7472_cov_25.428455_10_plen_75_part_00